MISTKSADFKFIDRGKQRSIVLIPGWATDYRIFNSLDIEFNYLIPLVFSPFTFYRSLLSALEENQLQKVSLFGWSLGGFLAFEFAAKQADFIDELILVGIRRKYSKAEIEKVKASLRKSKKACLYKFYSQCFYDKEQKLNFKKAYLKDYCRKLELDFLIEGLDYLVNAQLPIRELEKIKKLTIIHGEFDNIAPIQEAIDIKISLAHAKFVLIKDAGHLPFLREGFKQYII
ncbi:MAG: alpha/beta hydrolase [Candidatus Omnitrophota bacterium]